MTTSPARRRILLTNDDGARAPGLVAAYEALRDLADVTVVAPADQRSGASHTITLEQPLRARPLEGLPGFMVDFTPVDCVKLALRQLLPAPPDLVVSGINRGSNAGHLVHYSGTVGAAVEAVLIGVPAVAVSQCGYRAPDYAAAARVTRLVVEHLLAHPLPPNAVLNVNVPQRPWSELRGFRWCRQSCRQLHEDYERRTDPRGGAYYWLTGEPPLQGASEGDDLTALDAGYVALTPLTVDWTHEGVLAGGAAHLPPFPGA